MKTDIIKVADEALMIIDGYAFNRSKDGGWIRVLNLNDPDKAIVLTENNKIVETTMDDIEAQIVIDYFNDNKEFMENANA